MFRIHIISLIECTLFLLVCSCNGQKGARSVEEIVSELTIQTPDTSLYGSLKEIVNDTLVISSEFDDQVIRCSYEEAQGSNGVIGSLTIGNRYAMLLDMNEKRVNKIINVTELSGQWFYDINEQRGFNFTAAGALSSINPDEFCFRKWKFYNGKIILYYVEKNDVTKNSKDFKTDTTEIEQLTSEDLDFAFRGQSYHCQRKHEAVKFQMNT